MHPALNIAALVISACCTQASRAEGPGASTPFPAKIPLEKPTDRRLSAAVGRLYDVWNPHEDRANELYSNFKYSRLDGFSYDDNTSRRDPSKVLRLDGTYYVWYTRRQTAGPPAGPQNATDTIPSFDWDLAEIWYATSKDGFQWEEQGPAVRRAPDREYGWRSVSTPDVLAWGGKYYLYFQGFDEIPGLKGDRAAATVAEADSPKGPWRRLGRVDVDRPLLKRNNLRFEESTYFQPRVRLPDRLRSQISRERDKIDSDTVTESQSSFHPSR